MSWIWITLAVVLLAYLLQAWSKKEQRQLPPGPKSIPILGHLHLIGKNPHQGLQKLAQKHGPIMYVRFGSVPNIIVSSPQAAKQFLKIHDLNFASRPPHDAAKHVSYDQRNLSFGEYGPYWRSMRKLCTLELLNNIKINSFQALRKEEIKLLVDSIVNAAREHVAVDLSAKVSSMSANVSCRMIFGKKYEDKDIDGRGFKAVIEEGMKLASIPNLANFFPFLGKLDLQGFTKRMKAVAAVFDKFLEKILDEHAVPKDPGHTKDFVDIMLDIMKSGETEFAFERSHIKAVLLDMLAASVDTAGTTVDWTMSELLKHPQVMDKVQKELAEVVGMHKLVDESDLESLVYLNMVIREVFRLHPPSPLLLPHQSIEDCNIDGFFIPKKTTVMVNVYAIGRDSEVWNDAEDFIPERFIGSNIDIRGQDFELLPFGSGRRGCPGMQLGIIMVRLVVATLVHCFDWKLPNGMMPSELDMTEEFGLVVRRANHLTATPSCRLHVH
ncbi:putative flavonoid 3-hydroxylase [Heracleum sosnowskyi]|uniref:Flavonoid 3-hydroxylase n=1 Tax=Heracleum sosnowskyi TaxID=360622 RepID=A0AAD8HQT0_9APIA|nr:putative flavonoid 3-hydroxylase [Heracleum sosnowskyi]